MPLPPSGPISMQMINVELARPASQVISLNEPAVRALAQVPSGVISLSNFYGKSNIEQAGYVLGGWGPAPLTPGQPNTPAINSVYQFSFPSETGQVVSATTPSGTLMPASLGSTSTNGYSQLRTGSTPPTVTWPAFMVRFSFSSKTFAAGTALPAVPPNGSPTLDTNMQTDVKSYLVSGYSGPPNIQYIRKIDMPTETVESWATTFRTVPPPSTNAIRRSMATWTAWKNYSRGYAIGGERQSPTGFATNTDGYELSYPTDTVTVYSESGFPTGNFANNGIYQGGLLGQNAEHGYYLSGFTSPSVLNSNIGRMTFSTRTANRNFQSAGVNVVQSAPFSTPTAIYWLGGLNSTNFNAFPTPPLPAVSTVWRYTFSTATFSTVPTASIPARRGASSVVQSTPVFG